MDPTIHLYTLAEARAILDDPVRDQRYLATTLGPQIDAHLRWLTLAAGDRGASTRRHRLYILARLAVDLPPEVGVAELAYEHLELYFVARVPEGSWRTHRSHINQFVEWAIQFDLRTAKNPVRQLPKLRPRRAPEHKVFDDRERELILDGSRFMDDPPRDLVRAFLMLDGGIRKAEARGCLNSSVDPVRRTVTVIGKGHKERVIPVRGGFWLAWERHLLEPYPKLGRLPQPDDHVWFPARVAGAYGNRVRQITAEYPERPMGERGFHEWWVRLVGHTGVEYRKPHMTRHSFATAALDASDGDIYGVKELLGHESIRTTELYLHSSTRRKESVADSLARTRR